MAEKFVWELDFDTGKGADALQRFSALARSLLSDIRVEIFNADSLASSVNAARNAAGQIIQSEQQVTANAQSASQLRSGLYASEASSESQSARTAADAAISQQRRITEGTRAEIAARRRAEEIANSGPSLAKFGGAIAGGAAAYLTVQGAKQIFNYAKEIATLDTTVSRASKAFEVMSGSAGEAEKRLRSIVSASGGTVDNLQAIQIANQATSLGLAKTSAEFENLTRAARAVTFVSPVIHDVQSAITELALASSNLSYRRLDQLGLSVTEVKDRMKALQDANKNLDESQAFLQASTDALNAKFGPLLDSVEAQAGGVERLTTAWSNFTQGLASGKVGEVVNRVLSEIAKGIDQVNAALTGDNSGLGTRGNLTDLIQFRKEGQKKYEKTDGPSPEYEKIVADLEKLKSLYDEIDQLAAAGAPGAELLKQKITELIAETVASEQVTKSAAAELTGFNVALSVVKAGLDSSTEAGQAYAKLIELIGEDQARSNADALALADALVSVEIQYRTGEISAAQYQAAISSLTQAMYGMTLQAADAANAVARLNNETRGGINGSRGVAPTYSPSRFSGLGAQNAGSQFAADLASGGHNGLYDTGGSLQNRNKGQAGLDQKEREKADREAASAATRAARTGASLYDKAQSELKSTIDSVIKVSKVTQQDIEDAKNGTYKEKGDEYLRRLRDEVKNGKDYKDVSIEDAAAGLNKIGVDTVDKSKEQILALFESAFSDLSLFSNKDNLSFLNDAAVEQQLKIKELAKQGQANVYEHYGVIVGDAVNAAIGYSGGGGGAVAAPGAAGSVATAAAINVDGKGIGGKGIDIVATITDVTFAEGVDTDFSSKFKASITIGRDNIVLDEVGMARTNLDLRAKITPSILLYSTSFSLSDEQAAIARANLAKSLVPTIDISGDGVISADPAKMGTIRDGIGKALTPSLTFSPASIVFTADDAKIVRDRLALQITPTLDLGAPDQGLYLGAADADRIKTAIGAAITPTVTTSAYIDKVFILATAVLPTPELSAQIKNISMAPSAVTETPLQISARVVLGEPSDADIAKVQQKVASLLNGEQAGPKPLALSDIALGGEKKKANPLVGQYIDNLVQGFNDPAATLPLLGVGSFMLGVIDSGFEIAKTQTDIGTGIVTLVNQQIFSETNTALIKSMGFNIFQLIVAGVRTAQQRKDNNVGQQIVDGIVAQVINATAEEVEGSN